ncbi:MAG: ribonuclease HI [Parvibaculales bacterium]
MKEIIIYTDGACSGNPGPGGWGVFVEMDGLQSEHCGGEANTTNNRMEMTAALEALRMMEPGRPIRLITDSTYVRDGITSWIENWKRRGWKTAAKKPVKNVDLWQALDAENQRHKVSWEWIKGHAGHPGNEKADELARLGMSRFQ